MKTQTKIEKSRIQFAILMVSVLMSASAFAASTGTLKVSGTVAVVNDLVVTPNGTNNTTLNITAGESAKNIASVAETSNNGAGYIIQVSSANAGKLVHSTDNTKFTNYTISYGGSSYAAPNANPTTVKTVSSLNGLTTQSSAVSTNVTAYPSAIAGTYSDTITLSIVAN